jgi:hypothetical protein
MTLLGGRLILEAQPIAVTAASTDLAENIAPTCGRERPLYRAFAGSRDSGSPMMFKPRSM